MANNAKHLGRLFLVQRETATPGTYATVGNMKSTSWDLKTEAIDTTDKDSENHWRELIAGGIRSLDVSLAGSVSDAANVKTTMMADAVAGTIANYKLISDLGDSFVGPFQLQSLSRSGSEKDNEQYTAKLASAGSLTYAAAS